MPASCPGCGGGIERGYVVCRGCWDRLTPELQQRVRRVARSHARERRAWLRDLLVELTAALA